MQHIYENADEVVVFLGNGHRHRVLHSDISNPPVFSGQLCSPDSQVLAEFLTRTIRSQRRRILESEAPLNVFTIVRLLSNPSMVSRLLERSDDAR